MHAHAFSSASPRPFFFSTRLANKTVDIAASSIARMHPDLTQELPDASHRKLPSAALPLDLPCSYRFYSSHYWMVTPAVLTSPMMCSNDFNGLRRLSVAIDNVFEPLNCFFFKPITFPSRATCSLCLLNSWVCLLVLPDVFPFALLQVARARRSG
jgi:hypothetical protein